MELNDEGKEKGGMKEKTNRRSVDEEEETCSRDISAATTKRAG